MKKNIYISQWIVKKQDNFNSLEKILNENFESDEIISVQYESDANSVYMIVTHWEWEE